ncbi:glycoside hydrolase [Lojkania enalia]|uniref:Glycoside hydrolase n=1 Tax=Lojkania enalia TaxID=147567 RepID=A0A9P4JYE2_9PLEO|nr:glycoside hydrolase [Didymosphaeria enalia]
MDQASPENYPRPDFQRSNLQWQSLNGPWDFIFDDEDIGLKAFWHQNGLPDQVQLQQDTTQRAQGSSSESANITAKIAANPENLIHGNLNQRKSHATVHKKGQIKVPFVFQTPASGINDRDVHEVFWYQRRFSDIRSHLQKSGGYRLLLRFGAVDYEATVWVNGHYVGGHRGGHVPFDVDVTDPINASNLQENEVTIRVFDSAYDLTQPRGKQYWGAKPESIFYTPSGGIWQSVWLESVPPARLEDSSHGTILRSNDIENGILQGSIVVSGRSVWNGYMVSMGASYGGVTIRQSPKIGPPKEGNRVDISLDLRMLDEVQSKIPDSHILASFNNNRAWRNGLALWSPEHPQLYEITLRLFDPDGLMVDEVTTTIGMRSLEWKTGNGTFKLNGHLLFQILNLDQGYWPDTLMTPPSQDALKADIEMAKKMGFNGCRKHQKVEDPVFLYWADRLGYLVWGEMANAYSFSEQYISRFDQEWMEAVKRDINHPCVITWTPVNESWGYNDLKNNAEQRNHIRSLYYMTKALDPTRPINDNCGWEHVKSDLTTFHDYADSDELANTCSTLEGILGPKAGRSTFVAPITGLDEGASHTSGAVVVCTEFGGVNIAPASKTGHEDEWGYTTAADPADLLSRIEKLVNAVVDGGHCGGFVYTQLTDIEQETNGLHSFDRKEKLEAVKLKSVMENAQRKYFERRLG